MERVRVDLTVGAGLKMASRHPAQCSKLLANNLYPILDETRWFTKEWRLKFCAYFLQNLADQTIEAEVDEQLLERLRHIPLTHAIKLIEHSRPEDGCKALVALICGELRGQQRFDTNAQYLFYNELFGKFFPDCRLS